MAVSYVLNIAVNPYYTPPASSVLASYPDYASARAAALKYLAASTPKPPFSVPAGVWGPLFKGIRVTVAPRTSPTLPVGAPMLDAWFYPYTKSWSLSTIDGAYVGPYLAQ